MSKVRFTYKPDPSIVPGDFVQSDGRIGIVGWSEKHDHLLVFWNDGTTTCATAQFKKFAGTIEIH